MSLASNFGFGLPTTDQRPARAKVFELLGQNADAYVDGIARIESLLPHGPTC